MRIVLIPAFNEEKSIASVINGCRRMYPEIPIVVVNNNSTDETAEIVESMNVRLLNCEKPGYSQAIRCGYQWALKNEVNALVQLDGDGQHPTYAIGPLFAGLEQSDWVIGSRHKMGISGPIERRFASWVAGHGLRRVLSQPLHDWSSGMWGLSRQAITFLESSIVDHSADADIRISAIRHGLNLSEIPVAMDRRYFGKSMHEGWRGLGHLLESGFRALSSLNAVGDRD
jgi:glycosyltransferase involved in cell wall biosynthesis